MSQNSLIYTHTHTRTHIPFTYTNPLNVSRCRTSSYIWPGAGGYTKHDPASKNLIGKSYSQLAGFEVLLLKATRWRIIIQKKRFEGEHPKLSFSLASAAVVSQSPRTETHNVAENEPQVIPGPSKAGGGKVFVAH